MLIPLLLLALAFFAISALLFAFDRSDLLEQLERAEIAREVAEYDALSAVAQVEELRADTTATAPADLPNITRCLWRMEDMVSARANAHLN